MSSPDEDDSRRLVLSTVAGAPNGVFCRLSSAELANGSAAAVGAGPKGGCAAVVKFGNGGGFEGRLRLWMEVEGRCQSRVPSNGNRSGQGGIPKVTWLTWLREG
jgi:hypothetical protein